MNGNGNGGTVTVAVAIVVAVACVAALLLPHVETLMRAARVLALIVR